MASEKQSLPCDRCGEPRDKSYVSSVTDMCLVCARASQLAIPATSQQVEKASNVNKLNSDPQPEAEETAGGEVAPSVGEGQEPSHSRKRRIGPSAAKGAGGNRLTPACANCKKSKIRCAHRRVIDEDDASNVPSKKRKQSAEADSEAHIGVKDDAGNDSDTSAEMGAEDQTPPSAKRSFRIRLKRRREKDVTEITPLPAQSEMGISSKRQTRGGLRKRNFAENEEEASPGATDSNAAAAASDDGASTERSRRGRKPNPERIEFVEVESHDDSRVPIADSAATRSPAVAPGARALFSFPADNVDGAALLAVPGVLIRELHQTLEVFDTKLQEAKKAFEDVLQAHANLRGNFVKGK